MAAAFLFDARKAWWGVAVYAACIALMALGIRVAPQGGPLVGLFARSIWAITTLMLQGLATAS